MQIEFQCKSCSQFLTEDKQKKGHEVKCQHCGAEQIVPLQGSIDVGNIIEDHMVQEEIGHGAMGKVFLASHLLMNRQVALKTISPKVRQDDEAVDNFIQELQMGAQLSHPNIVTVYTAGYADGVYYISMQYIDGFDMNQRIEVNGPMDEKEALAVVSTVALSKLCLCRVQSMSVTLSKTTWFRKKSAMEPWEKSSSPVRLSSSSTGGLSCCFSSWFSAAKIFSSFPSPLWCFGVILSSCSESSCFCSSLDVGSDVSSLPSSLLLPDCVTSCPEPSSLESVVRGGGGA